MNSDHYFYIGSTHKVCEDYALSGSKDGVEYAIVCDGCSGSPDTDFGSRLLARAALQYINHAFGAMFGKMTVQIAEIQANSLGLSRFSLDSTLLTVTANKDEFFLNMFGDGNALVKFKDGSSRIYSTQYPNNAPYYLSYLLDTNRDEGYTEQYIDSEQRPETIIVTDIYADGNVNISKSIGNEDPTLTWVHEKFPKSDIEFIAVMSDGVESFEQKLRSESSITSAKVSEMGVMKELTSFKNTKGKFVERRVTKALKDFRKEDCVHTDDVSIAAVYNESTD